jgi:hypothetical protein
MITGMVNARYEMAITLSVRNSAGQEQEVEAYQDWPLHIAARYTHYERWAAMISPVRQEILNVLAELSETVPEVRLGQLMANLSYLARGLSKEAIWDLEDEELLESARKHLELWRSKRGAGILTNP